MIAQIEDKPVNTVLALVIQVKAYRQRLHCVLALMIQVEDRSVQFELYLQC